MNNNMNRKYLLLESLFINKKFQSFVMLIGAIIISLFLGKTILKADTVWELPDEAGYLSNTAYFLGDDWNDVRASIPYYAYGYSVFLIPAYLFTSTGVQLIRAAMFTNLFFLLGTYFILIYLLENVGKQKNRIITSSISFISCFNSYLCCNVLKVNCELLSTFWYCLTALILYKTIKYKKWYYYALLGLVSSYLFFIHTRMIVIVVALMFTIIITLWQFKGEKSFYKLCSLGLSFVIFFIIFYYIKQLTVFHLSKVSTFDTVQTTNLIDKNYIIDRIKWFTIPQNFKLYYLSFLSKLFYTVIVSASMIFFGYIYLAKDIIIKHTRDEEQSSYTIKVFFLSGMIFMLIACTLNGAGKLEDFKYFFYSRYYENTVIPMIAFSLLGFITIKWKNTHFFMVMLIEGIIGIITSLLGNYIYSDAIKIDTSRIPGLSWAVKNTNNYCNMIFWGTIISILIIGLYFGIKNIKISNVIMLSVVFIITYNSTILGIDLIYNANISATADVELAEYIRENLDDNKVYLIDDNSYNFSGYYSRLQVLLKDIPLQIIYEEELDKIYDIPNNAWVVTYTTTTLRESYLLHMDDVMVGAVFELWHK